MAENVHQGWLYTRDGEKFAPITLIDDVLALNGKTYKEVVNGQIKDLKTYIDTFVGTINTKNNEQDNQIAALQTADTNLAAKMANFDASDSDALYITDKNNNVIAYINENGVHSIDFTMPNDGISLADFHSKYENFVSATNTTLANLTARLANFNGEDSDTLYIIDKNDNVIAYINATGVQSMNFTTPEGNLNATISGLAQEIKDREALDATLTPKIEANTVAIAAHEQAVNQKLANFNGEDSDQLFIIDKNDNVIAYINEVGVHSLNFYSVNTDLEATLAKVNQEIINRGDAISELKNYVDTADQSIKNLLVNFDGSDSEKLFIIDKNDNVIAYIDSAGIHSINLYSENYDFETIIPTIRGEVTAEADARAAAITSLKSYVDTQDKAVTDAYKAADTTLNTNLTNAYKAADTALNTSLTEAYKAADTALNTSLTKAYEAADASLKTHVDTADGKIRTDFAAADDVVRSEFAAADATLKASLEGKISAVDGRVTDEAGVRASADNDLARRIDASNVNIAANASELSGRLGNIDSNTHTNAFYIIDKNDNTIAVFDSLGLRTTNVTLQNGKSAQVNGIYFSKVDKTIQLTLS